MSIHNRGLDGKRPVHPECTAKAGDSERPCTCEYLWQGAQAEDFGPMAAVEAKRSMRRQASPVLPKGFGSDHDESEGQALDRQPDAASNSTDTDYDVAPGIVRSKLERSGFWRREEQWKPAPVWHVEKDRIAAFNDIQAKWGSEFAHAWLSNVAHGYRLPRTQEQFCWLKSRDYL